MYISRNIKFELIVSYAWKAVLSFLLYSGVICILYEFFDYRFLKLPFLPIGVIGTAVAFYVGFKNTSSYERLWEARKIWGSITNLSRTWAVLVTSIIDDREGDKVHLKLISRHVAYIHLLKWQLRKKKIWGKENQDHQVIASARPKDTVSIEAELLQWLSNDDVKDVLVRTNPAIHLLKKQLLDVKEAFEKSKISELERIELQKIIKELIDAQGACERTKSFPFPRQYAFFSKFFVYIFIGMLPFGIMNEVSKDPAFSIWAVIPLHALISWIYYTMERIGDSSENPYEDAINDIPMSTICRNIEIDLFEILGVKSETPKLALQPKNNILL